MTEQNIEEPRDRKDLKIQALLEKISNLTTQYENNIADLRVDLTISEENNKVLISRLEELAPELEEVAPEDEGTDVLEKEETTTTKGNRKK